MKKDNKIGVALIGFGYWGPNLARNITESPYSQLICVCELSKSLRLLAQKKYPHIEITNSFEYVLKNPEIAAIVIATPPESHFSLALEGLKAGKHILVEKPLARSAKECNILIEESERNKCILMVDHTFRYTGAVTKMKELATEDLGQLNYYDSVRINLGLFQRETNVLWDLAVHDLSILDSLVKFKPIAVSATGIAHIDQYPINTGYMTIYYNEPFIAHIHCSWMAPVKIRRTLLGGSRKMVLYDDIEPTEKIKIYDKGIEINPTPEKKFNMQIDYRTADILSPKIDGTEALARMIQDFFESITNNKTPLSDASSGHRVVSILESADKSLILHGEPVEVVF